MEIADAGVEASRRERGNTIVGEEGVREREHRVERVPRRPAGARPHLEGGSANEVRERAEVGTGAKALLPAQFVRGLRARSAENSRANEFGGLPQVGPREAALRCVARGVQKKVAGVVQLASNARAGDYERGAVVVREAVLLAAEQDVAARGRIDPGLEPPVAVQERHGDPGFNTARKRGGGDERAPEEGDTVEVVQRHLRRDFAFDYHLQGEISRAQDGALGGDEERVCMHLAAHDAGPGRKTPRR